MSSGKSPTTFSLKRPQAKGSIMVKTKSISKPSSQGCTVKNKLINFNNKNSFNKFGQPKKSEKIVEEPGATPEINPLWNSERKEKSRIKTEKKDELASIKEKIAAKNTVINEFDEFSKKMLRNTGKMSEETILLINDTIRRNLCRFYSKDKEQQVIWKDAESGDVVKKLTYKQSSLANRNNTELNVDAATSTNSFVDDDKKYALTNSTGNKFNDNFTVEMKPVSFKKKILG